jgi:hypothetical protein
MYDLAVGHWLSNQDLSAVPQSTSQTFGASTSGSGLHFPYTWQPMTSGSVIILLHRQCGVPCSVGKSSDSSRNLCDHAAASVGRARFVTAGAIDQKLCTYVPLDKSNLQTKSRSVQSDFWPGHQVAITPELMAGSSPKFFSYVYLIRIHDIIPRFLIWPTFEGRIGQSSKQHRCWHVWPRTF